MYSRLSVHISIILALSRTFCPTTVQKQEKPTGAEILWNKEWKVRSNLAKAEMTLDSVIRLLVLRNLNSIKVERTEILFIHIDRNVSARWRDFYV